MPMNLKCIINFLLQQFYESFPAIDAGFTSA